MIYFVTNRKLINKDEYIKHIEKVSKKADYVIFREKDLDIDVANKLVKEILKVMDKNKLIINSFYEIANSVGCYGVHFTYNNYLKYHKKVKEGIKIGVSVHSEEEVQALNQYDNIDYIMFGHVFESQCKKGVKPRGLEKLNRIKEITKVRVVAIGGINEENIVKVREMGIEDVGIMSGFYYNYKQELL